MVNEKTASIKNPILPGFNPDPSIIRVGDNYYIATSTFEWFPGVRIHHSKDLVHWRLLSHALTRTSQIDMTGDPSSGGIFAPCLSYHDGTYYLVYTDVKTRLRPYMDCHNYLVTTTDISGEWSEPVYLNSSGFDPSLFHDDEGRKWLSGMMRDYRKGKPGMGGIILQEYLEDEKTLTGEVYHIFTTSGLGNTEGPHIYKRNGWYYLIVAEGGTGYKHAVTMARSKNITGPYEVHPENPVLTSADKPGAELQRAGHADIIETRNGEWYMVHLCGRPLPGTDRCVLGRETAIQKVVWKDDGWLYMEHENNGPLVTVPGPGLPAHPWKSPPERDDFDDDTLRIQYQTLRLPLHKDAYSLTERPGFFRLKGRSSLCSLHDQSLIARRQEAFRYTAATCLEFEPETFQHMAGLICIYNTENFYYARISCNENREKTIGIEAVNQGNRDYYLEDEIPIDGWVRCYLRVDVDYRDLQFSYSRDNENWKKTGPVFDAGKLSDQYAGVGFTGAMVGICCQDLERRRKYADFDFFEYRERS
jgi:xylan 1,4-beta-xylosidase